jgi:hypothetical protein
MKRNHYLILGGIALIGGYLWYKNDKDKKARKASLASLTPTATSATPMTEGEASNFEGARCTCDNGFTSWCAHGDCNKCCGSFNKPKYKETRHYTFMKKERDASNPYSTSYGKDY